MTKTDKVSGLHVAELEGEINKRFEAMIAAAEEAGGGKEAIAALKFNRDVQTAVARTMCAYPNDNLFDTGMRVAGGMAAGIAQLVMAAHPGARDSAALDVIAEIAANTVGLLAEARKFETGDNPNKDIEPPLVVDDYTGKRH